MCVCGRTGGTSERFLSAREEKHIQLALVALMSTSADINECVFFMRSFILMLRAITYSEGCF